MTEGNPNDFLMVNVGRVGEEERLKYIKPILEKIGPGVRLCIVGDGPQLKELHQFFSGTNTVITGFSRGDELSSAFASADAFVMPSDSEKVELLSSNQLITVNGTHYYAGISCYCEDLMFLGSSAFQLFEPCSVSTIRFER